MNSITEEIRRLMVRDIATLINEIELFPDDTNLWQIIPGISNSAGNLTLHIIGNLRHYIGHVLGGNNYERNREAEFRTTSGSRNRIIQQLREVIEEINRIFPQISEKTLADSFPEQLGNITLPCRLFLLHLCTHLAFHLGQVGYLRRILTGENKSTNPVSSRALVESPTINFRNK